MNIPTFRSIITNALASLILAVILSEHVTSKSIDYATREEQWDYLVTYEHALKLPDGNQPTTEQFEKAVRDLQRFFKLKETGNVDEETLKLMMTDRCGTGDRNLPFNTFTLGANHWIWDNITWSIGNVDNTKTNIDEVRRIVQESMAVWAEVIPKRIFEAEPGQRGLIHISFLNSNSEGEHGDGFRFYSHTVAHAFYPGSQRVSGDVHFNLKKPFSYKSSPRSNEFSAKFILVHELGHAFGLDHSLVKGSVMYPTVSRGFEFAALHADDKAGMQARYDPFYLQNSSSSCAQHFKSLIMALLFVTLAVSFWNHNKFS